MSGTYEHIDVPPTLIAFAMGVTRDDILIHNSFEKSGFVYKASVIRNQNGTPDFDALKTTYEKIYELIGKGVIVNAAVSEEGGALSNRFSATERALKKTTFLLRISLRATEIFFS